VYHLTSAPAGAVFPPRDIVHPQCHRGLHAKKQISLHLDNSHPNPETLANLAADGFSLCLRLILEFNDSLSQGAALNHEAITEIDLGFSLISGLFYLPCYLDLHKFRSVALLKNPALKPET